MRVKNSYSGNATNRSLLLHLITATAAATFATVATLFLTGTLPVNSDSRTVQAEATHSTESSAFLPEGQTPDTNLSNRVSGDSATEAGLETDDETLLQLQRDLLDASLERSQLAQSVADLSRQLSRLESEWVNEQGRIAQQGTEVPFGADTAQGNRQNLAESESALGPGFDTQTDDQRRLTGLLAAGVDSQVASDLQFRQDQYELRRLELIDLAEREGWIDSEEFDRRMEELEDRRIDVRQEIGDTAYDRYLFETGRRNRVIIASVLNGSAADTAGLQRGDVILGYAGERVFSTRDLQARTRSGTLGEMVTVNYERGRQSLTLQIPRGPMGVTLNMASREPS